MSSQRDSSQPSRSSRARIGWIVPDANPAAAQISNPFAAHLATDTEPPRQRLRRILTK
jgi:hypothetical protein